MSLEYIDMDSLPNYVSTTVGDPTTFLDVLGSAGSFFGSVTPAAVGIGSIAGALNDASDTRAMGNTIQTYLDSLGQSLNRDSQFQGYGVTSGLGTSTIENDGSINLGVGGQYGNAQNAADASYLASQNFANQSAMPIQDSQNDIYNSIMAMQNPELNRMQAVQQANEYAMGRGGVRGTAYGGTAEDAAMARARAQTSSEAAFNAREMANAERRGLGELAGMFGQYGNEALKTSYLPMATQMALLQRGAETGTMGQTGQLTGLDYLSQMGLGGATTNINAMHSANQLTGNLYNALLSNMGGTQGADGSAGSGLVGMLSGIPQIIDGAVDTFTNARNWLGI